eukprot:s112_g35.t2
MPQQAHRHAPIVVKGPIKPMLPAVAATLAWMDRPALWRPRHVSTVAAAFPPWQAMTFARNVGEANSEVTSAIAFANYALRGLTGKTQVCRPASNAFAESLQRKVLHFARLVCVGSSTTKMHKGAAKSASQAPFLKVWAQLPVLIAVLGAMPARKGSLSARIAGLGTTNLLWLRPVASNVNQALAAIQATLRHLALNVLLEAMQEARQSECSLCPAGWYGNASSGATSNETCSICPSGRAGPAAGLGGFDSCGLCPAGRYAVSEGSTECSECPAGSYSELLGATSPADCIACPAGTFSNETAVGSLTLCQQCPAGTWSSSSATACEDCQAGTASNTTAATSSSTCEDCSLGSFVDYAGASECLECPAGRWSDQLAQTVCSQCAAGTWSDAVAAVATSTCQQCPAGRFSDVSGGSELNSCQSCAKGTWSDQLGVTICQECEVGKWSDATGASSDVCQDCAAGRYGDQSGQSSLDDCLLCDPGTWSSEGLTSCYNCSAGRWSDTIGGGSISTCIACDAGRFSTLVSATSIETCVACPVKTFASQSASTACADCEPGQASFEGSSSCSDCGAGFYEGPTSCEQCPVARYSDSKQASCSQCEAGYVVNSQRTACIPCSLGRFSDTQGAEACQDCGAGRYGIQAGGISLETACEECPAGRVSNGLAVTSLAGCLQCSPGNFAGGTGGSSCEPCQAGRYQESSGQSASRQQLVNHDIPELLEQLSHELEFHHERLQSLQAENRNLKELHEAPPIDKLVTSTSINLATSFPPATGRPPSGRTSQVSFAGDLRSPRISSHQPRRSTGFASESSGTRSLMVRITAEERLQKLAQRTADRDSAGIAGIRTKQFSAEKPWYVINPDSNWFATCWQCATFVGLIFVALITPIQVGLLQLHFDALFVVSLFVDLIFFVDMFLQFCTAYSKRTVRGVEWEVRMHRIVAQKTWFFLDFITLIPFDLMAMGGDDSVVAELKTVKVIRILRLLKLMRLLKSSRTARV